MNYNLPYSSRQRVRKAIRHEQTDRIPKGELCIKDAVISRELNTDHVGFEERFEFVNSIGLDIYTVFPDFSFEKNKLINKENAKWPDIEKWTDKSLFIFAVLDGALETGMRIHGWMEFLKLTIKSPSDLFSFIDTVEKLNISLIKEVADKGVDGIIIADDVAFSKGLIINPKILRKYFLPSLARQVEEINRLGINAFYHSDGDYREIIPDLLDIHIHGIQCIELQCGMDILDLQNKYGNNICLWGHIDTEDTLKANNPQYLQKFSDSMQILFKQNGLILGTNCGIYEGTDISGLKALYKFADKNYKFNL